MTHTSSFKSLMCVMWIGGLQIFMHAFICICVRKMNAHAKIVTAVLRETHTLPRCPMVRFQMHDVTSGISTAVGSGHRPVLKQWEKALKRSCKCFPMLFSSPKDYCVMICLLSLFYSRFSVEVSHIRLLVSPPFFLRRGVPQGQMFDPSEV